MAGKLEIKPAAKPIKDYYAALAAYARQKVKHETALRSAFQNLLDHCGRKTGWTLIPELTDTPRSRIPSRTHAPVESLPLSATRTRPDGTFRDDFYIDRGHWEAKDTADDLSAEIKKKIAKGYPLTNIIFEDTREARLYQNGKHEGTYDLTKPQPLCDLLNAFFSHTEPAHDNFEKAVGEFKQRVPDLAKGLVDLIAESHKSNAPFKAAFEGFFELCKSSLNPNLRREAVDEMLVQHLLTERLIRTIFDNQDFTRRNVIAAEVEKVIDALVSKSFNRHDYLKQLDRFYLAIEAAAKTITGFSEKQHFLNVIYERFFQGYSVKVADTHGIVYTPQEIVDFMCASVEEVLQKEFGKTLGDKDVQILDPCTGTGNFIVNLINRIPKRALSRVYKEQLFANEVMLLPYYIAALNIEHAYFDKTGSYEPFEGLCFVDSLDLAESEQRHFGFMTEANTQRVERQKKAPITVILGNPPYNVGQLAENDRNKNRKYVTIDERIRATYGKDSAATSVSKLNDPYVKFFRWARDRLKNRDGIICFVSNNSFVENTAFDGMRMHFARDFQQIFHIDLEGDVRLNPTLSGTQFNVFGIQVGVGITIAVRRSSLKQCDLRYAATDKLLTRHRKLSWLASHSSITNVKWQTLRPDNRNSWMVPAHAKQFDLLVSVAGKSERADSFHNTKTVFKDYSLGIATHRDSVVYDFSQSTLIERIKWFIEAYNAEVDRWKRSPQTENLDDFVKYDLITWDRDLKNDLKRGRYAAFSMDAVRSATYRPFTTTWVYFDRLLNAEVYGFPAIEPPKKSADGNRTICISDIAHRSESFSSLVVKGIADLHLCATLDGHQCFPFYIYNEDGSNRRENITDWALQLFCDHYNDKKIAKWDIFHYVYGLLHHKGYREKFADCLKRELPRIPLASSRDDFHAFRDAGKTLAKLHVDYESVKEWPLKWIETPGVPLAYRVEKMKLAKDKKSLIVNDSLVLDGIPKEVFDYRLGNRSALDWVIDQYQIYTDKKSGITSDPNREDDPEYIVRLVGQVIRVSVETVKIVNSLPKSYGGPPSLSPKTASHREYKNGST
ncbi:MAG: type ISP restriction/modification enzyme [Planctomycetota bacterium]